MTVDAMQTLQLGPQLMESVLAKVVLSSGIFLCFLASWSLTLRLSPRERRRRPWVTFLLCAQRPWHST